MNGASGRKLARVEDQTGFVTREYKNDTDAYTAAAADRQCDCRAAEKPDWACRSPHGHDSCRRGFVRAFGMGGNSGLHHRVGNSELHRLYLGRARWPPARGWLPDRLAHRADDGGRDLCFADGSHLHRGLHEGRSRLPALFCLHQLVHFRHVDAGDGQQLPAAFFWLGSRRPGVLPVDRFLVSQGISSSRQPQGLPGQSRRRLRPAARGCGRPDVHGLA